MAFVIGWNLILEYVIGTASVARGYSMYIDSLCNGTIQSTLRAHVPIDVSGLSQYPDFLAFGITLSLTSKSFLLVVKFDTLTIEICLFSHADRWCGRIDPVQLGVHLFEYASGRLCRDCGCFSCPIS